MDKKQKPPIQNSQFFGGYKDPYDWDGTEVCDALDYYIPEWRHRSGNRLDLATGHDMKGVLFRICVPISRSFIYRCDDDYRTQVRLNVSQLKQELLLLSREGDSYDGRTDKRYLMMMDDLKKRYA